MSLPSILASALAGALLLALLVGGCHVRGLRADLADVEAAQLVLQADTASLAAALREQSAAVERLAAEAGLQAAATEAGIEEATALRAFDLAEIDRLRRAGAAPSEPDSLRRWALVHARSLAAWSRAPPE